MLNPKKKQWAESADMDAVRQGLAQSQQTATAAANQAPNSGMAYTTPNMLQPDYAALANRALEDYRTSRFNYDLNVDPAFRQAKEAYMRQGQLAAKDVAAQAAALTGGYGNSYGTMAAQQQYNAALQRVNDIVPELEANAYAKYRDDQNQRLTMAQIYNDLDNQQYNRQLNMAQLGAQYGDYGGLNKLGIDTGEYQSKEAADRDWELLTRERQKTEWTQAEEARALQLALQKAQYKDYSALQALGFDMSSQKQQDLMDKAIEWAKFDDYRLLRQLGIDTTLLEAQKNAALASAYAAGGYTGGGSSRSGAANANSGSASGSTSGATKANSGGKDESEYKTNYWNLRGEQTDYIKDALQRNGYKFTEVKYWTDTESGPAFVAKDAKGNQYSIQVNEKTGEIEEPKKRT